MLVEDVLEVAVEELVLLEEVSGVSVPQPTRARTARPAAARVR